MSHVRKGQAQKHSHLKAMKKIGRGSKKIGTRKGGSRY